MRDGNAIVADFAMGVISRLSTSQVAADSRPGSWGAAGAEQVVSSISVIIPTLNRPSLLAEAVDSALNQSRMPEEIIVVDDGSVPPVDGDDLVARFGDTVRVIRNEVSQGLAWARNQGAEAARGDYLVHLDDDDLYAPELLAECASLLDEDPQLELVFIGVEGFGRSAEHFNRVHPAGTAKVIEQGGGRPWRDTVYVFGDRLIHGLLNRVPMPFQRVMARRTVWQAVTRLRYRSYQRTFALASEQQAREMIRGTLRDSEWALYAGLTCRKTALLNKPLYRQRCEAQGRSSKPEMRQKHLQQSVIIKSALNDLAQGDEQFRGLRKPIRESLSKAYFDAAYECMHERLYRPSFRYLWHTARLGPRLVHIKLFAKLALNYFSR